MVAWLVVIDPQRIFADPASPWGSPQWPAVLPNINRLVDAFTGTVPDANAEGTLHWVPREELLSLPLWEGDRHWLPLVFDPAVGQFHGVLPYRDGRPVSWSVTILPG